MSPRKKSRPAPVASAQPAATRLRTIRVILLTLGAGAGLIGGIYWLGEEARRGISNRDRYQVHFADINCNPPAGIPGPTFLSEVRYLSNFPEQFASLDAELPARLNRAFMAHPLVESVERVSISRQGTVEVALCYRQPVLAVRTAEGLRLVDRSAVLLPLSTSHAGLPELVNTLSAPPVPSGQHWPDPVIARALELVEAYHPSRLEKAVAGWRLTMPDGRTLIMD